MLINKTRKTFIIQLNVGWYFSFSSSFVYHKCTSISIRTHEIKLSKKIKLNASRNHAHRQCSYVVLKMRWLCDGVCESLRCVRDMFTYHTTAFIDVFMFMSWLFHDYCQSVDCRPSFKEMVGTRKKTTIVNEPNELNEVKLP